MVQVAQTVCTQGTIAHATVFFVRNHSLFSMYAETTEWAVYRLKGTSCFHTLGMFDEIKNATPPSLMLNDLQEDLQETKQKPLLYAKAAENRLRQNIDRLQSKDWQSLIGDAYWAGEIDAFVANIPTAPPHLQKMLMDSFAPEFVTYILTQRAEEQIHEIMSQVKNKTWSIVFPFIPQTMQQEFCNMSRDIGVNNIVLYCSDLTKAPAEVRGSISGQAYIDVYKWFQHF